MKYLKSCLPKGSLYIYIYIYIYMKKNLEKKIKTNLWKSGSIGRFKFKSSLNFSIAYKLPEAP